MLPAPSIRPHPGAPGAGGRQLQQPQPLWQWGQNDIIPDSDMSDLARDAVMESSRVVWVGREPKASVTTPGLPVHPRCCDWIGNDALSALLNLGLSTRPSTSSSCLLSPSCLSNDHEKVFSVPLPTCSSCGSLREKGTAHGQSQDQAPMAAPGQGRRMVLTADLTLLLPQGQQKHPHVSSRRSPGLAEALGCHTAGVPSRGGDTE